MNIIILGAGRVGSTLATHLVREGNDVTVVDTDAAKLQELQHRLDIRTICGIASHPEVIAKAGGKQADMVIAVTSGDETNMIACQVAYTLFNTPHKIARIRSNDYLDHPELFHSKATPIDVCISPERVLTRHIQRLVEYPGALQVLDFASGKLQLLRVKLFVGDQLVDKRLRWLRQQLHMIDMRLFAVFRHNKLLLLTDALTLNIGDELWLLTRSDQSNKVLNTIKGDTARCQNIMIGGGGHIGMRLARALEDRYQVKVIDNNVKRTAKIAEGLSSTTVLLGEVSDKDLLLDENIEYMDVFCAVTNDDEANIMACMQAKRLGAKKVMALINRPAYVDIMEEGVIDVVISPQEASINSILSNLRQGDIANIYSLRKGEAEVLEVIAHGDKKTTAFIGRPLSDVKLPPGVTVGALVRNQQPIFVDENTLIEENDHLVLCVFDKEHIHAVEKIFRASATVF